MAEDDVADGKRLSGALNNVFGQHSRYFTKEEDSYQLHPMHVCVAPTTCRNPIERPITPRIDPTPTEKRLYPYPNIHG